MATWEYKTVDLARIGRWAAAIGLAGAVLAGCGGGSSSASSKDTAAAGALPERTDLGVPSCKEWMSRPVTAKEVQGGCADSIGVEQTVTYPCTDGTVLYWSDAGWGYVGQTMRMFTADDVDKVAPESDRTRCPA